MKPLSIQEASQCGTMHDTIDSYLNSSNGEHMTFVKLQKSQLWFKDAHGHLTDVREHHSISRNYKILLLKTRWHVVLQSLMLLPQKQTVNEDVCIYLKLALITVMIITWKKTMEIWMQQLQCKIHRSGWYYAWCCISRKKQKKILPPSMTIIPNTKLLAFQCLQHQHAKAYSII